MIRKLVRHMLAAQILSSLTVTLCLLIDSIMVGRFLGRRALTAYGLASPLLLVIGAVGTMLCTGIQVACGRSLGRGDREQTDIGYSSAVAAAAAVSLAVMLPVLLLRTPISRLLGADEPELLHDTAVYMAGFGIGIPASVGALILVPFLQMAGQSGLLIAAVLGMTVTDVALDLLNVFVFHGGMFGMGLASAVSYYAAVLIAAGYFLSKRCVYAFSPRHIRWGKILETAAGGVPWLVSMASSVVFVFCVNHILMHTGGGAAVAVFSAVSTVMNSANCISAGSGGVALTLSGVLYYEEDRTGLKGLLRALVRASLLLGPAVTLLLAVIARPCAMLFLPAAVESQAAAVHALRIYALGLTFCCLSNVLRSIYQGTGRVRLMEMISVTANAVLPVLFALLFSRMGGTEGVWFLFAAAEIVTLLGITVLAWHKTGRFPRCAQDMLLLGRDFGVPPEDMLEADPKGLEEVMDLSRRAEEFCLAKSGSRRLARDLALCIEEMGSNIVTHGFAGKGKDRLTIRLQHKEDHWTLRFRDNCTAFDPIRHVTERDMPENAGIRLVMRTADEARYTFSMNLNNLTLILRERC